MIFTLINTIFALVEEASGDDQNSQNVKKTKKRKLYKNNSKAKPVIKRRKLR